MEHCHIIELLIWLKSFTESIVTFFIAFGAALGGAYLGHWLSIKSSKEIARERFILSIYKTCNELLSLLQKRCEYHKYRGEIDFGINIEKIPEIDIGVDMLALISYPERQEFYKLQDQIKKIMQNTIGVSSSTSKDISGMQYNALCSAIKNIFSYLGKLQEISPKAKLELEPLYKYKDKIFNTEK